MDICLLPDGSVEIIISKDGLPSRIAILPTITCKDKRLQLIEDQLDGLALRGYWVDGWKWIKNEAFDRKGEKTSIEIKFRMCKNKEEANIIGQKIKEIIKRTLEKIQIETTKKERKTTTSEMY